MASPLFAIALAAAIPFANGYFTFACMAVNGEWQPPTRYIRNKTDPFEEPYTPSSNDNIRHYNFPTFPTDLAESVRCGRDNMAHASDTDILKVRAGDTIEFVATGYDPKAWQDDQWYGCPEGRGMCAFEDPGRTSPSAYMAINHPGPLVVHLSKAPDGGSIRTYDGSGEWVKIYTVGLEVRKEYGDPVWWIAHNGLAPPPRFIFKLPPQTPAGQYLIRVDVIWPGFLWKDGDRVISDVSGQLYPSCAQIEVESDVVGHLPKGVKIPEDLCKTCPGMQTSLQQYNHDRVDEGYVYPGGPLWDGEKLVEDRAPSS